MYFNQVKVKTNNAQQILVQPTRVHRLTQLKIDSILFLNMAQEEDQQCNNDIYHHQHNTSCERISTPSKKATAATAATETQSTTTISCFHV